MIKPIKFDFITDSEAMEKAINEVKDDLKKLYSKINIQSEKIVYPTAKEYYCRRMKQKAESYSREWLGTIYHNNKDIVYDRVDFIDGKAPPFAWDEIADNYMAIYSLHQKTVGP